MGKSEVATASLGIKILLSDLILQMNEHNFDLIKKMLYDGNIEDCNEYYNEAYSNIIGYGIDDNTLPVNYLEFKEYVLDKFKTSGSYNKSKFSNIVTPDLYNGCLLDKYLLVPIKKILSTTRWGYDRYGSNSTSCPIDFDLSVPIEEYKDINNFKIVFIIKQNSS